MIKKTLQKRSTQILSVIIIVAAFFFSNKDIVSAKKVTCSSFTSQKEAQAMFDSDKIKYKRLDGDHDGKACESLK